MKEADDVFSRHPLYCGRASSDVIGCHRPTGCVFVCMLQTWVTLTAFHEQICRKKLQMYWLFSVKTLSVKFTDIFSDSKTMQCVITYTGKPLVKSQFRKLLHKKVCAPFMDFC